MNFSHLHQASEFLPLFVALFFVVLLPFVMLTVAIILGAAQVDPEKLSAYECGFNPFEDARKTFDIGFYLVAVLFILFDVEIALLFPLISVCFLLPFRSLFCVSVFFFILVLGFWFEWRKGALDWS